MFCDPSDPVVGVSDEKHAASWKKMKKLVQNYCTEVQIKSKKKNRS